MTTFLVILLLLSPFVAVFMVEWEARKNGLYDDVWYVMRDGKMYETRFKDGKWVDGKEVG